jgi:LCP family protein required for cell wall assembly
MIVTPAAIDLSADQPAPPAEVPAPPSEEAAQPAQPHAAAPQPVPGAGDEAPSLSQETLNILLLGTDARPSDTEPTRTDALVLVRVERDTGRVSMLSIPRDLWVDYAGGGEGRINAAYAIGEKRYGPGGGPAVAKSTVGRLVGVPIDHFVLINFQGFETLIDQLGGITVNVPQELYDPAYPTEDFGTIQVRFREGPQLLDGERALIYARTRHADSDFGRNQRQQLVLMSIFNRVRERGVLQQLTSLDDYTGALRGYVKTDITTSKMLEIGNFARTISTDDVLRYAIDSSVIVDLRDPATFAAEPKALRRIVSQFKGEAVSTAGGE